MAARWFNGNVQMMTKNAATNNCNRVQVDLFNFVLERELNMN